MRTKIFFLLSLGVNALLTNSVLAQSDIAVKSNKGGYAQDSRANAIRSGTGLCWHTSQYSADQALPGCDAPIQAAPTPTPPATPVQAPAPKPSIPAAAAPKKCDFTAALSNDDSFEFDKFALTEKAKAKLNQEIIPKIKTCTKLEFVMITGHTDLLGSHSYNQKLSEKRATAVADYLLTVIPNTNLDSLGMGKTQQIKACEEKLARKALIECLAPNRRVVIEVKGMQ